MKPHLNLTPEEWSLIETYLDQKEESIKTAFWNSDLSQIPDIEEKIVYVEKIREEIEDSIRWTKIKEFHKEVSEGQEPTGVRTLDSKKRKSKTLWYAIAAVLVILFGVSQWSNNNSSERIFKDNFKPDIGLPLKMDTNSDYEFYEGMVDYKQGKYEEAIVKWQALLNTNTNNDTLIYFLGVSHLALGDAENSLKYLGDQNRFAHSFFNQDAAYYAALALIKEGKTEEAKTILKNTPSDQNNQLLKKLK